MHKLIGALVFALLIPSQAGAATAAEPNVLRWSAGGEISTMDPHGVFSTANASLLGNIYESLVRQGSDLRLESALAVSWRMEEPTRWRFTLRHGVHFHDGAPMTAADVVASIKRAASPGSPYLSATHMIRDAVVVDDDTVDVLLYGPDPILLNELAGVAILSLPWMQAHNAMLPDDPTKGRESYTTLHANGTGPFRLVSRQPDVETVLERFPGWWDQPKHNIDRVILRPIPIDATRVAALLSGELDLISPAPLQDIERIRHTRGLKLIRGQDLRVMFVGLNVAAGHRVKAGPDAMNPLSDVRVRRALYAATDTRTITRRIMDDLTNPITTMIAPEVQGYDPSLATSAPTYNLARAKALLAEAHLLQPFALTFDCPVDRFVNAEQVCQAIAAMWSHIGVKTTVISDRYPAFLKKINGGESDAWLMGWANTPQIDASSIMNNMFHTRTARDGSWNAAQYSDPVLDSLVERTTTELDPVQRQALMSKALRIEAEAVPYFPLYREPMVFGAVRDFDIPASPDGKMRLWLARFTR